MKKAILLSLLFLSYILSFTQNGRSEKRGIAYGYQSQADMAVVSSGLSWWYNWSHQPEPGVSAV